MNIGIIDADLLASNKHSFPNLACMKLSSYHKAQGDTVNLLPNYDIGNNDLIYVSKVFSKTEVPNYVIYDSRFKLGGTGFFYDKAPPLPDEIEHAKPDYSLYKPIVEHPDSRDTKYYSDYSIGFTTRGCFRKCSFCVNKNSNMVIKHSPLSEFIEDSRKKVCLLDDNILGFQDWKAVLQELNSSGKRFEFKQGMDIRLLTEEKANILSQSNYDGDFIFAFDNIDDKPAIETKLTLWRKYNKLEKFSTKLYVFCGFDRKDVYDRNFWKEDIESVFIRIATLMKYNCASYIMRHENYRKSPFKGMYVNITRWANQPSLFRNLSYREFCEKDNNLQGGDSASKRYNSMFEKECPEIASKYFDLRLKDLIAY